MCRCFVVIVGRSGKAANVEKRKKGYYKIVVMTNRHEMKLSRKVSLAVLFVKEDKKERTVIDSERVDRTDGGEERVGRKRRQEEFC